MKRDLELIRSILLSIEELSKGDWDSVDLTHLEVNPDKLYYHFKLLHQSGYIDGIDQQLMNFNGFIPQELTTHGHDFLDTIRDDVIWTKTKEIGNKSGAFTFDLLSEIAKGLIKTQIKKYTGVET